MVAGLLPYEAIVIGGAPAAPEAVTNRFPTRRWPPSKRTRSPSASVARFTRPTVCHALSGAVPSLESDPAGDM